MRFANTRVLVTGAGSGIGRATCLAFGKEGAALAAADVDLEAAQASVDTLADAGAKAVAVQLDVTQPDSVTAAVDHAVGELGGLDVLVNNAAETPLMPFLEQDEASWDSCMQANLVGPFLCAKEAARRMIAQGRGGKIVNLASVAGLVGVPNRAAYVSSKHAVVGLTKEMAMELAEHDIQVNAVAPGVVETGMTAGYFDDPNVVASLRRLHPAGRWAQPEEIANLILFLASAEAHFITGATYPIDGGFMAGKSF